MGVNQSYTACESFLLSKISSCAWCAAHHYSLALRGACLAKWAGLGLSREKLYKFVFIRYDAMSVMKTCVQTTENLPDEWK